MRKKYIVTLTDEERAQLRQMISGGTAPARNLARARILLKADSGGGRTGWGDEAIARALEVGKATVARVRERFVEEGFEAALTTKRSGRHYPRAIDGEAEAHLIALACGAPPEGRARWTLRLLAARLVELEYVESASYEAVRKVLKKTNFSHGRSSNG
jgi:transposase